MFSVGGDCVVVGETGDNSDQSQTLSLVVREKDFELGLPKVQTHDMRRLTDAVMHRR